MCVCVGVLMTFYRKKKQFYLNFFLVITARHQAKNVPGGEQSGDAVDPEDGRPVAICAERESLTSNPLLSVSCSSTSIEATNLKRGAAEQGRMKELHTILFLPPLYV